MKVLVFVEHDIIVRHFLHSRVFEALARKHEVVFVFPEKGHKRVTGDPSALLPKRLLKKLFALK